jgi:hypothetical protein
VLVQSNTSEVASAAGVCVCVCVWRKVTSQKRQRPPQQQPLKVLAAASKTIKER